MQMIQLRANSNYREIDPCDAYGACSFDPNFFKPQKPLKICSQIKKASSSNSMLLLDLDNTLTDTRRRFADTILDLTAELASEFTVDKRIVNALFAEVASVTTLHEYAFVVEIIASRLGAHKNLSFEQIKSTAHSFWTGFLERHNSIEVYDGVIETLKEIRLQYPQLRIVILTDSPEWIALERLTKVGVLPLIDGLIAIRTHTPRLRHNGYQACIASSLHRMSQRQSSFDTRHLLFNLSVPHTFAKPNSAGIELAAQRLGITSGQIIIVGDKDTKEGQAAANWRKTPGAKLHKDSKIHYVRAEYGNHDINHHRYSKLSRQISSLKVSTPYSNSEVEVHKAIEKFAEMKQLLPEIIEARS